MTESDVDRDREPLLTLEDLAKRYRVNRKLAMTLPLPTVNIGHHVRYRWSDVLAFEAAAVRPPVVEVKEKVVVRREPLPVPSGYKQPTPAQAGAVLASSPAEALPWVIYALVAPDDSELVRYVGRTNNPQGRYAGHCSGAAAPRVMTWIRELRRTDRWPVMMCLEVCASGDAEKRERHWIHHYRDRNQADLNTFVPRLVVEEGVA